MAARTVAKDIITLRGSAAIVSEFFGIPIPLLFSRFPPISFIFCIPVYFFDDCIHVAEAITVDTFALDDTMYFVKLPYFGQLLNDECTYV